MELSRRLPGPDVARALAMLGVIVMNFRGYLLLRGGTQGSGWLAELFDPWKGPLSTRFAATFVLVAGVGVTLMTGSAIGDRQRVRQMRWRLASRGLLLYVVGYGFDFIWPGTILPFYGAMFALAALLFTLRSAWIVAVGSVAAVGAWGLRWWRYERELDGFDTSWLTAPGNRSPRGLLFDVAVNGTHPLLPWLAFFCAGIVLGRALTSGIWRPMVIGLGATLYVAATIVASEATGGRARVLLSDEPPERSLIYTASALGTALVAFAGIAWIADRYEQRSTIDLLRRAGQLSLTIYVLHALVFNLVVDWLEWVRPAGLDTALLFALVVWVTGLAAAVWWQRRFGRGPAEQLYRQLTV